MEIKKKITTLYFATLALLFAVSFLSVLFIFENLVKKIEMAKAAETAEYVAKKSAVSDQKSLQTHIISVMQKNENILKIELTGDFVGREKSGFDRGGEDAKNGFLIQKDIFAENSSKKSGTVKVYYSKQNFENKKYLSFTILFFIFAVFVVCGFWLNSYLETHARGLGSVGARLRALSRQKEEAIEEASRQKELFDVSLESSLSAMLIIYEDKAHINSAFFRLSGYNADEMGRVGAEGLFEEGSDFAARFFQKEADKIYVDEGRLITKAKEERFVSIAGAFVKFRWGEVCVLSFIDLSALKQKDRMLLVQSRFVAMGEMIANIAHQWRQPLNVIQSSITKIEIYKQMGSLTDKFLEDTITNVKRQVFYLSSTIDDFRNFYKDDDRSDFFVAIDAVKKAVSLVEASYQNSFIEVKIKEEEGADVKIKGSANRLIQALINVLNNAKDAIGSQKTKVYGVVCIECKKDENCAVITIKDSGGGIETANLRKIFEPYFSTKNKTQGAGIGLYMTKQIIESSFDGVIEASNEEFEADGVIQKGASFTIRLPLMG